MQSLDEVGPRHDVEQGIGQTAPIYFYSPFRKRPNGIFQVIKTVRQYSSLISQISEDIIQATLSVLDAAYGAVQQVHENDRSQPFIGLQLLGKKRLCGGGPTDDRFRCLAVEPVFESPWHIHIHVSQCCA